MAAPTISAPSSLQSLADALKAAKIACGAADNPKLTALCMAEATAIQQFVLKALITVTMPPDGTGKIT